ncbi:MAG: oxidoreductase [Planctomycetota bacterium]|nr:MAG: oxidoreductase [Planctomycetota bacterium]
MTTTTIGIIMNGVTGRMGTNQHLIRSIKAIRDQGGVKINATDRILVDPILVGRNEIKLKELCDAHGFEKYSTNLDELLKDDHYSVYFDSQTTTRRVEGVKKAIAAGKSIYCEKPTAETLEQALELATLAKDANVKNGVVQDKLWLPGFQKIKYLIDTGFFGKILSVKGEFGYWVFDGLEQDAQRPSWNYRKEDGGGMCIDMLCHWRYVIDNLFGNVKKVSCMTATHLDKRGDENGKEYVATADDAAYATFLTDQNIICHFNSSWCTRVRRDDLLTVQVDGTKGSAVAGLRKCWIQSSANTPKPIWNPDIDQPIDFYNSWNEMPDNKTYDNAFKIQWELFLRHLVLDEPFRWGLLEAAKGIQLAECGLQSAKEEKWITIEKLES